MKARLAALGVAAMLLLAFTVAPAGTASAAKKTSNTLSTPADGTVESTGQALTGTFQISKFVNQGGQIWAIGTVTNATLNGAPIADQPASAPVTALNGTPIGSAASTQAAAADPSCSILDLTLGPLHLDLLGLVVDLNQVHLTITAQQGSGNLLGNLLCAVAHLLDGTGGLNLTPITNLLNNILAAL